MIQVKAVAAALTVFATAVVALVAGMHWVHWTGNEVGYVSAVAVASVAFLTSLYAHFKPDTVGEPVAVGGSFTALVTTVLAMLNGIHITALTASQQGLWIAVVVGGIALISSFAARSQTTTVANAKSLVKSAARQAISAKRRRPTEPLAPQDPM